MCKSFTLVTNQTISPSIVHCSADFQRFSKPNIRDLCEYVGAEIPSKWQQFGRFVGVRPADLEAMQASESQWLRGCFTQVFDKWHNGMTSAYTWEKVAEALESRRIDEKELLKEIYKKLSKKMPKQ